ncbi:MAG: nucleotidyltransferase family protein [Pseudohongiellaceae bacterium]
MKAMILAAGFGRRMEPLTLSTPKPLLQVGGRSLIDWHLQRLADSGFIDVVINQHHLGRQLERSVGDGSRWGLRIHWSPEAEILETGGGIHRALPLLGQAPFAVINGDIWTDYDFARLRGALPVGQLAHLVLIANAPHNPGGDFSLDAQGHVGLQQDTERFTFTGISVLDPALFEGVSPGHRRLVDLLFPAVIGGRVSGEVYGGRWHDIGTPERLTALDEALRCGQADSR